MVYKDEVAEYSKEEERKEGPKKQRGKHGSYNLVRGERGDSDLRANHQEGVKHRRRNSESRYDEKKRKKEKGPWKGKGKGNKRNMTGRNTERGCTGTGHGERMVGHEGSRV